MDKPLDRLFMKLRFKEVLSRLPKEKRKILDIGCGPYPWCWDLLRGQSSPKLECWGVDKRDYFKSRELSPNFHFALHDFENGMLPFASESFDLVTLLAVLEHLERPSLLLKEAVRVLKPGGTFILTTPTFLAKPILEFLAFFLHAIDEREIADHKHYFRKQEVRALLTELGFDRPQVSYFEGGFNMIAVALKD